MIIPFISMFGLSCATAQAVEDQKAVRIVIVGDTRMGEGGFNAGFEAIIKSIKKLKQQPDVLIHLGDFVYRPKNDRTTCAEYQREIKNNLVNNFKGTVPLFVMGDNDVDNWKKKKESWWGCWDYIVNLDDRFDHIPKGDPAPGALEGIKKFDNVLVAILDTNNWRDPGPWLAPQIKKAKNKGDWAIIAQHEPVISIAWNNPDFQNGQTIKQINGLRPDLVFSGHHHAYQRFCPTRETIHDLMTPDWNKKCQSESTADNRLIEKGDGAVHIVSGGGGALLRPFAKNQIGERARSHLPDSRFEKALANSAVMNHFVLLDVYEKEIRGEVHVVCVRGESRFRSDDSNIWGKTTLECEKREDQKIPGEFIFEEFVIQK